MRSKNEILELEIPRDVIKHAKKEGVSIEDFRRTLEIFGIMQLVSETSKLGKREANNLSEKIKGRAWIRAAKRLNL